MSRTFGITLYVDQKLGTITATTHEEVNGQRIGFGKPETVSLHQPSDEAVALWLLANKGAIDIWKKLRNREFTRSN